MPVRSTGCSGFSVFVNESRNGSSCVLAMWWTGDFFWVNPALAKCQLELAWVSPPPWTCQGWMDGWTDGWKFSMTGPTSHKFHWDLVSMEQKWFDFFYERGAGVVCREQRQTRNRERNRYGLNRTGDICDLPPLPSWRTSLRRGEWKSSSSLQRLSLFG